jgi:hypothetical protein
MRKPPYDKTALKAERARLVQANIELQNNSNSVTTEIGKIDKRLKKVKDAANVRVLKGERKQLILKRNAFFEARDSNAERAEELGTLIDAHTTYEEATACQA